MLKPVKELSEKIENVTAHNLSQKIETPNIQDEIYGLTKSFNTMIEKLEQSFESQKQFSANAAHELRTPLAVLQVKLDVFEKEENHNIEEFTELISDMKKHTSRLSNLVISLLELTNLEEIPMENNIEVYSLIEEILWDLDSIAEKNNISLSLTGDTAKIIGDDTLLYRGFYNLIENAIKYNNHNGKVDVDIETKNNDVIIKISDTGIGIPTDMKERIFEPFVRVDKSRSREMGGAGLGLAITSEIIKKHGGSIEISDNMPKGTIFTVKILRL
ncbi:HAMP domain-containing sensor histidine kinase [Oceanirhabdus seepicola]|uniref:histidine kinase n=1 Tax=Oceanirhabdus seepicola TaxID=2828781 RepID=A0A9J6P0T6_9CLOT|nr:ATP-binding protein [Oceanirhabdus seepicola]MCM1989072.1 HAMP domain-containing protein [Oceanirhabdus seepicola]